MTEPNSVERSFEKALVASCWLMAPMYLGLELALGMLATIFLRALFYYLPQVTFSGYQNFVSKFDFDTGADRPDWMGKVDFSGLKMNSSPPSLPSQTF